LDYSEDPFEKRKNSSPLKIQKSFIEDKINNNSDDGVNFEGTVSINDISNLIEI
jgi:hypothetical protein